MNDFIAAFIVSVTAGIVIVLYLQVARQIFVNHSEPK